MYSLKHQLIISNCFLRVFLSVVAERGLGDIQVDDVSFEERNCAAKPKSAGTNAASQTTSMLTTKTPQTPATAEVTCNFDANNLCGWVNDPKADLPWVLIKGLSSQWTETAPATDFSGTGYMAIVKGATGQKGSTARLISPTFTSSSISSPSTITIFQLKF